MIHGTSVDVCTELNRFFLVFLARSAYTGTLCPSVHAFHSKTTQWIFYELDILF